MCVNSLLSSWRGGVSVGVWVSIPSKSLGTNTMVSSNSAVPFSRRYLHLNKVTY